MEPLDIGVDSWIIQDGNYGDFTAGQEAEFALEFYPHSLKASVCRLASAKRINGSLYDICGHVVHSTESVWVLDVGLLAYQECQPPEFGSAGSWVEGRVYLGIDPFMYFESLKSTPGMPFLTCRFRVEQILLETTRWITKVDESGVKTMTRDEQAQSYRQVSQTDAWNDDDGNAHYILRCILVDRHI